MSKDSENVKISKSTSKKSTQPKKASTTSKNTTTKKTTNKKSTVSKNNSVKKTTTTKKTNVKKSVPKKTTTVNKPKTEKEVVVKEVKVQTPVIEEVVVNNDESNKKENVNVAKVEDAKFTLKKVNKLAIGIGVFISFLGIVALIIALVANRIVDREFISDSQIMIMVVISIIIQIMGASIIIKES